MSNITLRSAVGRALSYMEMDANFKNLNDTKAETSVTDSVIASLAQIMSSSGSSSVGYDGGTVQDVLDNAKSMQDYTALRNYTGRATCIRITKKYIAGFFLRSSTNTADNGGTYIVDGAGRTWERVFSGWAYIEWFGADPTGSAVSSAAIQTAYNAYGYVRAGNGTFLIDTPLAITGSGGIYGNKRGTTFKKTTSTANNITRTYVDSSGVTQTLTWNTPVIFDLVCPNNSYLVDFKAEELSFDTPSDGSVGIFNAQRVARSTLKDLFANTSAFFFKGYDVWGMNFKEIRSRFSKNHFQVDTGTSNVYDNVSLDTKHSSGGTGFTFINLDYSVLLGCSVDAVDRSYYFDGSVVTLVGCGSESFSRILQTANNPSNITIVGGSFEVWRNPNLTGAFTPYDFAGAGTQVTMTGTWLGVKNPAAGGAATYGVIPITGGASVVMNNVRAPIELDPLKWWFVSGTSSALTLSDKGGVRYYSQYGQSLGDASGALRPFFYQKNNVPAGSAQGIFRIGATAAGGGYGDNCAGKIRVWLQNSYATEMGFSGVMEFLFSAFNETTKSQNLTLVAQSFTLSNTGGGAFGGVTGSLLRNADQTIDFQLNISNSPVVVGNTNVTVSVEYSINSGTSLSTNTITGL